MKEERRMKNNPVVGIIMGSESDLPVMQEAAKVCSDFGVPYEMKVASAHRSPGLVAHYSSTAYARGIKVIIAGAGGAAHLPGVLAANFPLPVIGVPIKSKSLDGLDSLLSIVQMPGGVPVATVAIGNAKNAGLLAMQILSIEDRKLFKKVQAYKQGLEKEAVARSRKKLS